MTIVNIYTHMFGSAWLEMLHKHGGLTYALAP